MTRDDLPGTSESDELESSDDAALDDLRPPPLPLLDAEAGPAMALSERELALFADRIERQFLVQRARPKSRLSPKRLLLAGGLFAASAAAAVYVGVVRRSAEPAPVLPSSSGAPISAPEIPSEPAPAVVSPPALFPAAPSPAAPSPAAAPDAQERPTEPETSARVRAPRSDETPTLPPAVSAKQPAPASRIGTASRQNGAVAADRLAAANSLRSRHRYREALALYSQVIEMDPNGIQASAARVAAAEMKLEQFGDIAGAERLYREAKTQGGELTAEAQFGLSQVARARGDAPTERRALQDFLARHPESPLVSAARRRLSTLGAE
jgi:tetratricopeptide (TPR) repeat protein